MGLELMSAWLVEDAVIFFCLLNITLAHLAKAFVWLRGCLILILPIWLRLSSEQI